jgi:hypothetical protein
VRSGLRVEPNQATLIIGPTSSAEFATRMGRRSNPSSRGPMIALAAAGGGRPGQIEPLWRGMVLNAERDLEPSRPDHQVRQALMDEVGCIASRAHV